MNIDLATFNINTDELFKKLVLTKTEIEKLKVAQKQLRDEFSSSNKSVEASQKKFDDLNKDLQSLTKGTATYNQTLANRDNAEQELNKSLSNQVSINQSYQSSLTANQLELNKLNSQARSYQSVLDAQNRSTNESITLYERQRAELSLLQKEQRELGVALSQATKSGDVAEIKRLSEAYDQASKEANGLATELRGIDKDGGNFTSSIGKYKDALEDFKTALFSGDTQGLKNSFDAITGSIKGMITQSLAFIATPIGAAITAIVGIGVAAKAVFDFNQSIKESNQLLDNLGLDTKIRPQIEGLVKTFDVGFKEVANAVDQIMDLGLAKDQADALEQIKLGLVKAPDKEVFLSSLENNSQAAKNLGINLNEVIALQESFEATGSDAEATFGALQKAQLNLTKSNPELLKSLSDTLGATFSSDVLNKVKSGEITYTDALNKIKEKGDELKINAQQQADLQVALFGKSAIAAGGYEQILNNVSVAQDKQNAELTNQQKATLEVANANEELRKSFSIAEIKEFGSSWDRFKASAILTIADIINYLAELKTDLQPLIDIISVVLVNAFYQVKTVVGVVFDFISGHLKSIGIVIGGLVEFVKKVFQGDFKGAINVVGETFNKLLQNVQNTFNKIRNTIIDGLKGILSNMKPILEAVGIDVDKLQKKLEGFKGKVIENKVVTKTENTDVQNKKQKANDLQDIKPATDSKAVDEGKKKRDDAQKKLEEESKKLLDSAQKLADEKVKLAKIELDSYIEKNKSILDSEKFLTSELLKQENERLKNIEKAKLEQEKLEFDTANKKLQTQIKGFGKESELNETQSNDLAALKLQQKELELQYDADVVKIKSDTQKQITANETRYSNERIEAEKVRRAIGYQTEILDLEAKGATEEEIKLAQLDQQREIEVTKALELMDAKFQAEVEKRIELDELLTEEEAIREQLKNDIAVAKDGTEKIRLQNQLESLNNIQKSYGAKEVQIKKLTEEQKLGAISNALGQAAGLFKENTVAYKALAIAQATINTYLAATNALSAYVYPLGGIFAALAVAQGLTTVAKISGIQFAKGGIAQGASHANGGIPAMVGGTTPIELEGGEAIINKKSTAKYSAILSQINSDGGNGIKFATGGISGGVSNLSTIQNQFTNTFNAVLLAETLGAAVMEGSAVGTASGSQRGISDLNDNIQIRNGASF